MPIASLQQEQVCFLVEYRLFIIFVPHEHSGPNMFSSKTENIQTYFRCENDPSCQYGVKPPTLNHSNRYTCIGYIDPTFEFGVHFFAVKMKQAGISWTGLGEILVCKDLKP